MFVEYLIGSLIVKGFSALLIWDLNLLLWDF